MAQEQRLLVNFKFGALTSGITNSATSATSSGFASLPAISAGSPYIPITLFDAAAGTYENVWVTAHTASSTTVTISRGKEGSGGLAWSAGAQWVHAPTAWDCTSYATSSTLPSAPYTGQRVLETDTGHVKLRTGSGWQSALGAALPGDVGPAQNGTTFPPASASIQIRAGNASPTTNGVADASVAFRTAFPNGCIAAVANARDQINMGGDLCIWNQYASGFDFRAFFPNGTAAASVAVPLTYIAIGW